MKNNFIPKICTTCQINHVENCPECFGFGFYRGKSGDWIPVSAGIVCDGKARIWKSCDTCGGSIFGNAENKND